jgi:hypothetical protein
MWTSAAGSPSDTISFVSNARLIQWLGTALLVPLSILAIFWAVVGTEMIFYDSTGAYRSPSLAHAIFGVALTLGPIVVCLCLGYLLWRGDSL